MRPVPFLRGALALLLCLPLAACAQASAYEPAMGQGGKDVMWLPTPQALVEKMLDLARVAPRDLVMDLGSGDGRTVISAARRGARAIGVEYDPDMVALSRQNAEQAGVAGRAEFVKADLFETDLSKATVITMFLLPSINVQLRPRILGLKPGTRVVSNSFDMDKWRPDETASIRENDAACESYCTALLWIVPARVAGSYDLPQGKVVLEQEFQMLSGSLSRDGETYPLQGRVRGEELSFRAGTWEYRGRMSGGKLVLE